MPLLSPYVHVLAVLLIAEPTKAQVSQIVHDPEFPNQYYLVKDLMNIQKAWKENLNGDGVTICVNDPTGVDFNHLDLRRRFRSEASFNFLTNKTWPTPNYGPYDGSEAHGTMMAGLAAAEANNNCGVGVAYKAFISGLKTGLDRPSETTWNAHKAIAKSMEHKKDLNDIYCNSWGVISAYQNNVGYMHRWTRAAMKNSAENGRNGKGSIIVFSTGNGGLLNGTCSYDEYVSSIYTIGVSVITGNHEMSSQNVKCAGVTAVTYGRDGLDGIDNPNFLMPAAGLQGRCSKTAASSSASAAVASGILALVLQAKPTLGWRDVQHLIARSSSSQFSKVKWTRNQAGLNVSDGFGFGVMDAKALTDNAKIWHNVDKQLTCMISSVENVVIDGIATLKREIDLLSNQSCKNINYLEHVVLVMKFNFTLRRNIEVTLHSPSGTKSMMLRSGRFSDRRKEVINLSMLSLHHWGENPGSKWKLTLRNVKPNKHQSGYLSSYSLKLYGTSSDPMLKNSRIRPSTLGLQSATTARPPTKPPRGSPSAFRPAENKQEMNFLPEQGTISEKKSLSVAGADSVVAQRPTKIETDKVAISTSTRQTVASPTKNKPKKTKIGLIVGVVFGSVAVIALIIVMGVLIGKKRPINRSPAENELL